MDPNQMRPNDSWKTTQLRNNGKQKLMEAFRKTGKNFNVTTIEGNICTRAKSMEEYLRFIDKIVQKFNNEARVMQPNQEQHIQQQQHMQNMQQMQQQNIQPQQNIQQQNIQQQNIQQQNLQQQNIQQQNLQQQNIQQQNIQQQNLQQQNIQQQQNMQQDSMYINRAGNQQTIYQTNQIQRTPQNNIIQQGSPGMPMRGMAPTNSPMSRTMTGLPSPQSSMGYQRTQWSQPSPGNQQYGAGQFVQPRPPPPTNMQPILKMPDSTGQPHSNTIPSLSPNHPSPQVHNTSPGLRTPGSVQAAPSPGTLAINTIPSPTPLNNSQVEDDKEYMEKLKQLQKYIEPLSRMISKFNEDEEKYNNDLCKMKTLRDTLMNPNKRLLMSTLDKCEKVLQNWLDQKPSQPPLLQPRPDQHMCQPILNVIASATKSPLLNHTLKRTFGPAMKTLCGNYTIPEFVPNKRQKLQEAVLELRANKAKGKLSDNVKREIANLDSKFNIVVDEVGNDMGGNVQLFCYLNDPKLPGIPPIQISVPQSYPTQPPTWVQGFNYEPRENDIQISDPEQTNLLGSDFLLKLRPMIRSRLTMVNNTHCTISSLLQTWASSAASASTLVH
uniref:mediator of RNA polymerase II transcription subunit 15 isoform X1 n=1 Tax=Ciona intestinalis TaxID=7719 RepID=UPI0000523680|nr:mediator of RNA polymerase II transcription subunit 15 isoform X1 [Ciona intestinalis]|eukprot:XP_002127345.1 mediator of RNA polymerase II transcription subunit 15 isoform X1 [Ciona intestinalis]